MAKKEHKHFDSQLSINVLSDGGSENCASSVNEHLLSSNLNQLIAGKDICYSNSMIESFFRALKSNFLNFQKIRDKNDILRKIKYYVNQHNTVIPKKSLAGATPLEAYQKIWNDDNIRDLKEKRYEVLNKRRSLPPKPTCHICS